ncbi:MAG: hypothetical protein IJQ85_03845 [Selenomonadaceae bacterium]|nr:hypothetical protein [Selenomonadaceae bacterium]
MRATEAISFVFSYAATNLSRESSLKIFLLIFFHPFFIATVFIIFVIIDISWNCYREEPSASSKEIEELKAQIREMQMEIDILNEEVKILKKDRGVNPKKRQRWLMPCGINIHCRNFW